MDQDIVEGLKPHRDRDKAVVACIDDFEANNNRMRCEICRKRGLPVGSGFVGYACKQNRREPNQTGGASQAENERQRLARRQMLLEDNCWPDFPYWMARRVDAT